MSVKGTAARVRAGDLRAAAALMRALDDGERAAIAQLRVLYPHTGQAQVVGITGPPGAGKSTLVDALVQIIRQRGDRVGVVAVDPSSASSGGAILGDRIRMQRHATDAGVFIRSVATRGAQGGVSRSVADIVHVLDAMGFAKILVETVGVGQDEIDVGALTDTTVVVGVPGLGDGIQTLKAGILEIADVLVVNKADRDGADRTVADLQAMLALRAASASDASDPDAAPIEICKTVATSGQGVPELLAAIERHRAAQQASGAWAARRLRRAEAEVRAVIFARLHRQMDERIMAHGGIAAQAALVAARKRDPHAAADLLLG